MGGDTLEKWQKILCQKEFKRDFVKDKEIIDKAFEELCNPVVEVNGGDSKYKGIVEFQDNQKVVLEFDLGDEGYQLTVNYTALKLVFGVKTGKSIFERSILEPVCEIIYYIDKNTDEKKEVYRVKIANEKEYKQWTNCNEIESEKYIYESNSLIFDKDNYKRIINNLMNIATTGTFKGTYIFELKEISFEDNEIVNPFEY